MSATQRRAIEGALRALAAWLAALWLAPLLAACMSIGIGGQAAPHVHHVLRDAAPAMPRRAEPLVGALLIQSVPASSMADTVSIAYSRRAHEFAFYQFATWAERPTRALPRLLQRRLEVRGVAAAVGSVGEPMRADWLLTIGVDTLHHDLSAGPGQARLALTAELYDRRSRTRVAKRQFEASAPTSADDSAGAASALALSVAQVFDTLVPWLEVELQSAAARRTP
jgi:ABC-type uncharacterized transport system auxiliary subunit